MTYCLMVDCHGERMCVCSLWLAAFSRSAADAAWVVCDFLLCAVAALLQPLLPHVGILFFDSHAAHM